MAASPPSNFWLEFRLLNDGLDTPAAKVLNRARCLHLQSRGRATHFPQFPALPAELRLKIWEFLLAPRIVGVACFEAETFSPERREEVFYGGTRFGDPRLGETPGCGNGIANGLVPVLLHICQETRILALSRYERAFAWKVPLVLSGMDMYRPFSSLSISSPSSPSSTSTSSSSSQPPPPSSSSHAPPPPPPQPPQWSTPQVYFDFATDALYLLGALEPSDPDGTLSSPMTYFLDRRDTQRVRRAGVAFAALGFGEAGPQQIFGALFHVVDRFAAVLGGRVYVGVRPADEMTNALMGGQSPLVRPREGEGEEEVSGEEGEPIFQGEVQQRRRRQGRGPQEPNAVQKIWRDWYRGSVVTSSLANMQFVLVEESELEKHIFEPVVAPAPAGVLRRHQKAELDRE
ncbi:Uu.00g067180.m01.CDS01 [Anthostomella pinea]|uniref:Uu.00g067180.m01.CDS01 n=1 Tax=Anthostomella pinea TaxID=933095 RepID=A0AAI8VU36_9PEZI|nr:Uu.00g067180.m01.CDS01 [Anthostomella pinea]